MDESTVTKMQLHYWEAKQTFMKKIIKKKEDDFLVASDAELDAKLELLKSIDETNHNLLNLLDLYQDRICNLGQEECILGRFLRECGKHDQTKAGPLMSGSGKIFLFAGHQFILLRNILIRSFRDVQTFQYRAVTDTFNTVEQMEKSRTGYRAALLWMKDISKQLDPDAYGQMDKFKKIQNHVREKKRIFEKYKIDTIQKIDLLSASRCNLFSNILQMYQNTLKDVWSRTGKTMNIFTETFRSYFLNYEFTMLKELNHTDQDSDHQEENNSNSGKEKFLNFEEKLKELLLLSSSSSSKKSEDSDMLLFFEKEYTDNGKEEMDKSSSSSSKESKSNSKNQSKPLLDMNFSDDSGHKKKINQEESVTDKPDGFMPSCLIDFDLKNKSTAADEQNFFLEKFQTESNNKKLPEPIPENPAPSSSSTSTTTKSTTLDTWLNLFADIDPLSNPDEFEKRFQSDRQPVEDRNC